MTCTGDRARAVCALAILALVPQCVSAQDHTHDQPTWAVDVGVAGANIAVGALTAAATAAIRGEDVSEAFLKGAAGGAVVFAGKRVAVERFDGAGLLGRQIASVGAGLVVDGGHGREWFREVWLPIGPAWLQVRPEGGRRARVNLREAGVLIWAATRSELDFDLGRSVSNGAPVFVARRHRIESDSDGVSGLASGGVILLGVTDLDWEVVQRHENIHVIQHDYVLTTLERPVEQWVWDRVAGRNVPVDLGLLTHPIFDPLRNVREREAEALEYR
jgi:hypothetical protein